ncbi:MAG: hypothetical protein U9N53_12850 [Bacteroidota bacterium]|nr:hypothetical protein [Bacteroidota bacterium]
MMRSLKSCLVILPVLLIMVTSSCAQEETIKVLAGTGEAGFEDGTAGKMNKPIRFTAFHDNSVIFADINNHAIRSVNLKGEIKTIAGGPDKEGFLDGPADQAKFKSPHGVAYDPATGIIYVASASNHVIRMLTPTEDGGYVVSTLAGVPGKSGFADGQVDSALFNSPHGVVIAPGGGIYLIDIGNSRVRKIKDGIVSTLAGTGDAGSMDGSPGEATFTYPIDLVMDGENILIADAATNSIRKIIPGSEVSTIIVNDTLDTPHGVAIDKKGVVYEADMGSHRIISINKDGTTYVLAGVGTAGQGIEELNKPAAVLVHAGYLWIADLDNHQIKVIKL